VAGPVVTPGLHAVMAMRFAIATAILCQSIPDVEEKLRRRAQRPNRPIAARLLTTF
jgi:hypothetical protein